MSSSMSAPSAIAWRMYSEPVGARPRLGRRRNEACLCTASFSSGGSCSRPVCRVFTTPPRCEALLQSQARASW